MDYKAPEAIQVKEIKICIIEGPAGSGKSTLCEAFRELGHPVINSSLKIPGQPDRFPTDDRLAAMYSYLNDTSKLAAAMYQALNGDHPVVLIDRMLLSQVVYGAIRTEEPLNNIDLEVTYMLLETMLQTTLNQLLYRTTSYYRGSKKSVEFRVSVGFAVLLPNDQTLDDRRSTSNKTYPINSATEIDYYTIACAGIPRSNLLPLTDEVLSSDPKTLTEYILNWVFESSKEV